MARPQLRSIFRYAKDRESRNRQVYKAGHTHGYTRKKIAAFPGVHYSLVSKIVAAEKAISITPKA